MSSKIACISFTFFAQYLSERYAMVTQYFINLFVLYAVLIYIIYIELVEFSDAFNIKGVKCFFLLFWKRQRYAQH